MTSPRLRLVLHWCTERAPPPFALCADLRRVLHRAYATDLCQRCDAVVQTRRRVAMCLVRDERLCFACYHRARWPRP